jgi:hypothetical protein
LIVVPVAAAAVACAPIAFDESADPHERDFDWPAQACGAIALGALTLAAIESHVDFARAAGAFGVGVAALLAFRGAAIAEAGMTFGMYGMMFLLPLSWLSPRSAHAHRGRPRYHATSPFSGYLAEREASGRLISIGVGIIGCGLIVIGAFAPAASIFGAEAGLELTGLGMEWRQAR